MTGSTRFPASTFANCGLPSLENAFPPPAPAKPAALAAPPAETDDAATGTFRISAESQPPVEQAVPADILGVPFAVPVPLAVPPSPKLSSDQQKALRLSRLEYARRRKKEKVAEAKAAGFDMPVSLGKGVSSIDVLLCRSELDAYYALIRKPRTTLKEAHEWLTGRGFPIGMSAVRAHRSSFRKREAEQRQAVEMAYLYAEAARTRGPVCMVDACAGIAERQVFDAMRGGETFDAKHFQEIYKVLGGMARVRTSIEKIRLSEEKSRQPRKTATKVGKKSPADEMWDAIPPEERERYAPGADWKTRPGGHPWENWTPEMIEKTVAEMELNIRRKPAAPGSPKSPREKQQEQFADVTDKMRRILGIPLPHEEAEWNRKYDEELAERRKQEAIEKEGKLREETVIVG